MVECTSQLRFAQLGRMPGKSLCCRPRPRFFFSRPWHKSRLFRLVASSFFHPSCILDSSKAKAPFPSLHSLPSTHTARQIYTPTAPARMFLPAAKPTGLQVPSLSDPMGGQGDPLVKESPVDLMHSPNNCIKHICRGSNVTDTTFSLPRLLLSLSKDNR